MSRGRRARRRCPPRFRDAVAKDEAFPKIDEGSFCCAGYRGGCLAAMYLIIYDDPRCIVYNEIPHFRSATAVGYLSLGKRSSLGRVHTCLC